MKDLPIIFPIALIALLVMIFFTGAFAISEGATTPEPLATSEPISPVGTYDHFNPPTERDTEFVWYEDAAIWVCPLH
jgi:hypothetical protein